MPDNSKQWYDNKELYEIFREDIKDLRKDIQSLREEVRKNNHIKEKVERLENREDESAELLNQIIGAKESDLNNAKIEQNERELKIDKKALYVAGFGMIATLIFNLVQLVL